MSTNPESDTRERLLDAAEKLFAANGIGATSLRAVTAEAKANLASIHYHFGSKDALLFEVFARRIKPVNARRLTLLGAVERDTPGDLSAIVRAFVSPALELLSRPEMGGRNVTVLIGRLYTEPMQIRLEILTMFEEVATRFPAAISASLPHLDPVELFWRFHFMVGSMAFPMVAGDIVEARARQIGEVSDVDKNIDRLVRFISGGLAAPATEDDAVSKEEQGED